MEKKEAMKILKDFHDKSALFSVRTALDTIIPELRESNDEKIRQKFIKLVKMSNEVGGFALHKWEADEMLAWLEKQGKQKPAVVDFNAKDWYVSKVDGKIHDMTYNPTDKAEPKFKVGDWIVQENIGVYKIIEVCESWYEVVDNKDKHYSIGFDKEYMCHLWTIQDAKDGDVLQLGVVTVIFQEYICNGNCKCYYSVCNGEFEIPTKDESYGRNEWLHLFTSSVF